MRRIVFLLAWTVLPAGVLDAQVSPAERLQEVLPPEIAAQVLAHVEAAGAAGLPDQAMASLALEGVAKGRSAEEVLAAVEALGADMGRALEALQAPGREPEPGEVEAATAAMRMGVDADAVSELAGSQPSGRSLAVPLLVMGGLAERGLASDEALAQVAARLSARAGDAELLGDFPEVGQGLAYGLGGATGPALASGMAGFQVPVAGVGIPVGPPTGVGGRPENPGRRGPPDGRGPGG